MKPRPRCGNHTVTVSIIMLLAATACANPDDPERRSQASTRPVAVAEAADADAGCGGAPRQVPTSSIFAVPDRHVLYGFSPDGNLYRGNFNGGPWLLLQSHEFNDVNGAISSDRRWVVYGGHLKRPYEALIGSPNAEELWLFDLRTQRSRRILQRPFASLISVNAVFSPDNRQAAVFSQYDNRTPQNEASGLFLIDLAAGTTRPLGFSRKSAQGPESGWPSWSADGRLHLVYREGNDFHYAKVDPKNGRSERAAGRYDKKRYLHEFIENGQAMTLHEKWNFDSRYMRTIAASPDTSRQARIDDEHRLLLTLPDGHSVEIDKGRYDYCEGVTIGLTGWLDDDHLIYSNDGVFRVHQISTNRTRPIELGPVEGMNFFWSSDTHLPPAAATP